MGGAAWREATRKTKAPPGVSGALESGSVTSPSGPSRLSSLCDAHKTGNHNDTPTGPRSYRRISVSVMTRRPKSCNCHITLRRLSQGQLQVRGINYAYDTGDGHRVRSSSGSNIRQCSRETRQSSREASDCDLSYGSQRTREVQRDVVVGAAQSGQEVCRRGAG
jgi:hypothetical protein